MENEKRKIGVQVTEGTTPPTTEQAAFTKERLKKPVIFGVMGLACVVCLYLIFGQDSGTKATEQIKAGINAAVPQASGEGFPTDKGKAYEQEMLREREQQKRAAMMSLSDYWQSDSITEAASGPNPSEFDTTTDAANEAKPKGNAALNSYRSMQRSLNTFYRPQDAQDALRKENEALKEKLEVQQSPQGGSMNDRLALMEQSYKMAAKYFPGVSTSADTGSTTVDTENKEDGDYVALYPGRHSVVSQLQQPQNDSVKLARLANAGFRSFTTATGAEENTIPANSIRACVHQTGKVTAESNVQLRLLQEARIGDIVLPRGYILSAVAKFQSSRLQLTVVSLESDGSILPVKLEVYDLDGQRGLNIPYSPEVSAVNGTLANMGNTTGGSFTINRSAGQQVAADASRGLIQGVSGYFSKKVKAQKVTVKSGHQVFLVSKKQ
ncbi:conjugative transposon protein TraM [Flavobacterium rakeshii]|uniref:conjugative transposon protein TraM n=1 Tax=Flavobacterium rakeshii TaxID=1038845 RepID=UPI002E7B2DAD|nr:conjugative transposon protein TraM [Flavobacterium rakeshii]MEE1897023.1 conjugative transposon protein TraM [Flavobacterium rakeshii]